MKYLLYITAFNILCATVLTQDSGYNGEPGCRCAIEVGQIFRNFWDPTAYWVCLAQNTKAVPRRCPTGYAFVASKGGCITWAEWKWEKEKYPPSIPEDTMCGGSYELNANVGEGMPQKYANVAAAIGVN